MTCLGSAGAGENCACGVLPLSILRPRGVSQRAPVLGAPCYVVLLVGKNAGRTDAGSSVLSCAGGGEGATCLIVVESGVGVGVGGFGFGW